MIILIIFFICFPWSDHNVITAGIRPTLQTSLGSAVAVVVGCTKQVVKLDKLQHYLKQCKINNITNHNAEEDHKNMLAQLQVAVLAEKTKISKELHAWERAYTLTNNLVSPSYEEMKDDPTASGILRKLKYANRLIREWKINFD